MPEFVFTSPDGKTFRVRGPEGSTPEQAFQILQQSQGGGTSQPQAPVAPQEQAIPQGDWNALAGRIGQRVEKERGIIGPVRQQDLDTVAQEEAKRQGLLYGRAQAPKESTLGIIGGAAANMAGLSLPRLAEAYIGQSALPGAQAHEFLKAADQGRAEMRPGAALAGTAAGVLGQAATLPVSGAATLGGRALAAGAQAGILSGVDKLAETRGDLGQSAAAAGLGFGLGGAASIGVEKGIQAGRRLIDPMRGLAKSGPADQQASARVLLAAKNAGIDDATAQAKLAELGPDGFLADILGRRGEALTRTSANLSPDAREILETASQQRLGGQTDRLIEALSTAGRVPANRTPDELIEAIKKSSRPQVSAAYSQAQRAGSSILGDIAEDGTVRVNALNDSALGDLFNVPKVKAALKQAMDETSARVAIEGPDAASHWSTIDRARQILANEGFKTGDSVAKGLAKRLNETLDLIVPEGSTARATAQQFMKQREAIDVGAQAARSPTGDFGRNLANQGLPQEQIAQGYAAGQIERLNSRRGGGLNALNALDGSANQRSAMAAALGNNAAPVQRQIANERQFVNFNNALSGNSTTARQLIDAGVIGGAAGGGYLTGFDPMQAGSIAGLAVAARRGGSKLMEALAKRNEAAVAPEVARKLIARELPKLAKTETERRRLAEALMRQLTRGTANYYGLSQ